MQSSHSSIYSLSGDGYFEEFRLPFGLRLFRRRNVQKWTTLYHEVEIMKGIRWRHYRFGWTKTYKLWLDGKEPRVEPSDR